MPGLGAGPFVPTCPAVRFRRPTCGQSTPVESTGRVPQLGQWFTCGRWPGLISDYQTHHGGLEVLVLSRTVGEKIVIDKNITITITSIKDKKVRIGIDAPMSVTIDREEIRLAKLRSNQAIKG